MYDLSEVPWSDNPNAPKIPYWLYVGEKAYFAGSLIGAILYGIVVVLFFRCMSALFDPANRGGGGIKWGLATHTVAMFTFSTVYIGLSSNIQSTSFIDNREFSASINGMPGPVGYQFYMRSNAFGIASYIMLFLNNWLADGLLLYRCYIVYAKNYWAITFPCVMYLASWVMGVMFIYEGSQPGLTASNSVTAVQFGAPFFSISFALNILVTFMIITRLILHRRKMRNVMGVAVCTSGLYMATIAIIIESYALCALAVTLYLGTWGSGSFLQFVFLQVISQTQVIAPFLITLRIASRRAFTNDNATPASIGSIRFRSHGKLTGGNGTLPGGYPTGSVTTSEFCIGVETTIDLHRDSVSDSKEPLEI